jgi:hypothetical protein
MYPLVYLLTHARGSGAPRLIPLQVTSWLFETCITRVTLTIAAIITHTLRQIILRRLIFCLVVICRPTRVVRVGSAMCIKRHLLILGMAKASKTVSVRMLRTADAITGGLGLEHIAAIFDQAAVQ